MSRSLDLAGRPYRIRPISRACHTNRTERERSIVSESQGRGLGLYIARQASSPLRYLLEQLIQLALGWVPTVVGIGLRAVAYRLMMRLEGVVAIEPGVRIRFADGVQLARGVYLDEGVYLHACPNGIEIGENSYVMHHAELHVYNFRGIPHSGIRIGRNCLISEYNVLRGQGGIAIGDNVYTAPLVQMLAVNHVYDDPSRPIIDQGITAEGIVIEDDAWIGAGAIILDGVRVGKGAVVGAGAVVTSSVPSHTVVVGSPARVVRSIDGRGTEECSQRRVY
jgi:acetyltransferase-like isoleucine patch superfamily enzyme